MGYGPVFADMARRGAYFVDKILKGAKPERSAGGGDRPSSSWSINLKAADALGLSIPPSILARADELIE